MDILKSIKGGNDIPPPKKKKLYQTGPKENIFEDKKLFRGGRCRDIILDDVSFSLSNHS